MLWRRVVRSFLVSLAFCAPLHAAEAMLSPQAALTRAAHFLMENLSQDGGFLWIYEVEGDRQWGELEAYPGMIWLQSPGTVDVGHLMLDLYARYEDPYFLQSAVQVARVLSDSQLASGGWPYFSGVSRSEGERWVEEIGRFAWRSEEFHYPFTNGTFDDGVTIDATRFLTRLALVDDAPWIAASRDRAIQFVLVSQRADGGWPQRYPPEPDAAGPAYANALTLNDGVMVENIRFLYSAGRLLERPDLVAAAMRGMRRLARLPIEGEQPGWAMQYSDDYQPVAARSFEPAALATSTTVDNINWLLDFYRLTGEPTLLQPIPQALRWLRAVVDQYADEQGVIPRHIMPATGNAVYIHRQGNNVVNGRYVITGAREGTVIHYGSFARPDLPQLEQAFESADFVPVNVDAEHWRREFVKDAGALDHMLGWRPHTSSSDPCFRRQLEPQSVDQILAAQREDGAWIFEGGFTSNPSGLAMTPAEDTTYARTWVGDAVDTSVNCEGPRRPLYALSHFLHNMTELLRQP